MQFDGMALPEAPSKSVFQKIRKVFSYSNEAMEIPNHSQAQEESLVVYLQEYAEILCSSQFAEHNLLKYVDDILLIYDQLYSQKVSRNLEWCALALPQVCNFFCCIIL